ncbi:MAG: helix-turn-helix domain-containing protein, partial [Flavisolibacter sp.]
IDLDLHIHTSAGRYICGEETGMISSLEGLKGQPKLKPPFPAIQGYLKKPTIVNNVETLAVAMNMRRRTLNTKINPILNISSNDIIRLYLLKKAATLLASGHGVTQTAYTVGFETPSYFTQCFKEQYGQTPSEFANQKTA